MPRDGGSAMHRRLLATTLAAIGVCASLGVFLMTRAPVTASTATLTRAGATASTKITILPGSCAGGGIEFCFKPESVNVAVGVPVVWTNQTGVGHTASSCTPTACSGAPANTGSNTFSRPIGAAAGSTASFTFTSPGTYIFYCMIHGYVAMHGKITVFAKPTISSFKPLSGPPGTTVTITGKNLAHASRVTFNGVAATISMDAATKIVVKVPAAAATGKIAVTTPGGKATSTVAFKVT
jgi:plastocyanin